MEIRELQRDELDLLEPLWLQLHAHHSRITPAIAHSEVRPADESWRVRRSKYERWLEDPDTLVLLAEDDGQAVGYAFVTIGPGHATWRSGLRVATLQTLSVTEQGRGRGVGSALLDGVAELASQRGIDELEVTATLTNRDAHRFYEARGLVPTFQVFYGPVRPAST